VSGGIKDFNHKGTKLTKVTKKKKKGEEKNRLELPLSTFRIVMDGNESVAARRAYTITST
jgi:hypothetical protein